jgi:surface polysaccharide O-acyltransferase-like enzyme
LNVTIRTLLSADFFLPIFTQHIDAPAPVINISLTVNPGHTIPVIRSADRTRALDGARGVALILMLLSHTLMLLPGNLPAGEWVLVSGALLLTKAATPLFVFVFGMTMARVYLPGVTMPEGLQRVRNRMWRRAVLVFLSFELIVLLVGLGIGSDTDYLLRRLTYREPGHWAEVLNFYLVLLLAGPWVLTAWKSMSTVLRALTIPLLYFAGVWLSAVDVPPSLFVVKNIIAGYPTQMGEGVPLDSFPVLQLFIYVLAGLWLGEQLYLTHTPGHRRSTIRISLIVASIALIGSIALSTDSLREYFRNIALDKFRFPPQPPYILFGLAAVIVITLVCVWLYETRRADTPIQRLTELLGRHSLFVFNMQYAILFLLYGRALGLFAQQSLARTSLWGALLLATCFLATWAYERVRLRMRAAG